MKISANEIRVGNVLEYKNSLFSVLKLSHTQPGKGGAYVQVEMKDILNNTKLNERFRSSESVDKAFLEEEKCNFLYSDGDIAHFMNSETFEQFEVSMDMIGDNIHFLIPEIEITVSIHNDKPISIKPPKQVTLKIQEAEPYIKGQTITSSYKPAMTESGLRIMVPQFIVSGDEILFDTEKFEYSSRV